MYVSIPLEVCMLGAKVDHFLLYSWYFFFLPRDSVLYKCKVIIIMITFRLNVILTKLQETQNLPIPTGTSKVSFPILTSPLWYSGTAWGRWEGREKIRGWLFGALYDIYQIHPLPPGLLVYLNPSVSMHIKWKETSQQQTSTMDQ